jgi:hypothetical protein
MDFLQLPTEILLYIAEKIDKAHNLLALSCLTQATNILFLPYLYKFNIRHQHSSALLWGILQGDSELVRKLLRDYQTDPNTTDHKSRTLIFHTIRAQNMTIVRILLSNKRTDVN